MNAFFSSDIDEYEFEEECQVTLSDILDIGRDFISEDSHKRRRGRPALEIEGFTRTAYKAGNSHYICNKCDECFSKAVYTKNHVCKPFEY